MDTLWEEAVRSGEAHRVRELLALGAKVDARNRHGQTALMLAAHAGHQEVVETLLAHRVNLDAAAKFGLSALMLAIVAGHGGIAHRLVDAGADLSVHGTGAPGFAGKTAYDLAVERGMLALAPALQPKPSTGGER